MSGSLQDLKGKVVVVTGGTSGFGKGTAQRFLAEGARVLITGSNEERLRQARESLGPVEALRADAADPDDWERLQAYVADRFGRIDVLVNNAGSGISVRPITEQSVADIDAIIRLNLGSVAYGCRVFGRMMKDQREGTIVNVSSACATEAWPNFSVYAAAKAGVVALSKGCYTELRPYNVRVTALIPGAGRTGFSAGAGLPEPATPFWLEPKDVAEAIVHICRLPREIFVEEYRIWGMDQEVIPL